MKRCQGRFMAARQLSGDDEFPALTGKADVFDGTSQARLLLVGDGLSFNFSGVSLLLRSLDRQIRYRFLFKLGQFRFDHVRLGMFQPNHVVPRF